MPDDTMLLESPAAQEEYTLLKKTKVGDIRTGTLMPALVTGMKWICTVAEKDNWVFEGSFCEVVVMTVRIRVVKDVLVLNKEVA